MMMYKVQEGREEEYWEWMDFAIDVAKHSLCLRSKCGAVIVKDEEILGYGYNEPPNKIRLECCLKDKILDEIQTTGKKFKSDMTCCVHAEMKAILWALERKTDEFYEDLFGGSTMFFIRLDDDNKAIPSGKPYCTQCSKFALDVGIGGWVLWHKDEIWGMGDGLYYYPSIIYNTISFEYRE